MQFLKIFMITIYGNLWLFWTDYSATAADTEIPISYGHYMLRCDMDRFLAALQLKMLNLHKIEYIPRN